MHQDLVRSLHRRHQDQPALPIEQAYGNDCGRRQVRTAVVGGLASVRTRGHKASNSAGRGECDGGAGGRRGSVFVKGLLGHTGGHCRVQLAAASAAVYRGNGGQIFAKRA